MLIFDFATPSEIGAELGERLRQQRLAQNLPRTELALRADVSPGTVQNLENHGQASLESLLKIVMALGLVEQLGELFTLRTETSIKDMEAASQKRKRARRSTP